LASILEKGGNFNSPSAPVTGKKREWARFPPAVRRGGSAVGEGKRGLNVSLKLIEKGTTFLRSRQKRKGGGRLWKFRVERAASQKYTLDKLMANITTVVMREEGGRPRGNE